MAKDNSKVKRGELPAMAVEGRGPEVRQTAHGVGFRDLTDKEAAEAALAFSGQSVLKTTFFRRRHMSQPPASLAPELHQQYRDFIAYVGEAFVAALPVGLPVHYVRSIALLDKLGQRLDSLPFEEQIRWLESYIDLISKLALVANRLNAVQASVILAFAGMRESKQADPAAIGPEAAQADWRAAAAAIQ